MAQNRRSTGPGPRAATSPLIGEGSPALTAEVRDRRLYDAVLAYRAGEFAEAEAEARRLVVAVPGFFPAVLLLGMATAHNGRAAEGIELLREAIALDRRSIVARNELAILLRSEGRNDEATAEAKHAVRLRPEDPGSHNNLGLCYLVAGRVPLAIAHFKRAIALKPDGAMFHHNLGLALAQQSRDHEAMAAFRCALSADSTHAETLAQLGQLLFRHGQPEEAAKCYERAASLQADATLAAIHMAEALTQQGRTEEAEAGLRRAIVADPRSDLVHQVLGVLLQRRGRFDEANESLERATELQPKRISAYASLVLGKKIGAADDWLIQKMLALVDDPSLAAHDRSRLHYALGKAFDDLGAYEEAIRHFDRANEIVAAQARQAGRSFDRRDHKAGIDRTITGFTAEFFNRRVEAGSTSDLPVLIVGMPRSGTTLVEQILSSHREIGAAGELSYWTDRRILAGAAFTGSLPPAELHRAAEDYLALLRAAAPDSLRVTDKMPANFLVLGLVHLALPMARVIHCRRDPADTCLSIWSTPFGNPLDFAHDRSDLVFYYEQYARLMAHWREVIPPHRLLEIDYERLVAEPERVTRDMIDFCGLEWDDACLRHERNEHVIMTPSLWQARQPVYRDAVARWRRYENWLGEFHRLASGKSSQSNAVASAR
jgi:tetratricopeptide (TPR) repeat protein